jgi:PKD repeat protein
MVAANACGADTATATVSVCQPAADAGFYWEPVTPTVDEWIAFHGSASGSTPITYAWDFGDGGTGSGANVSHRYTAVGTYQVAMTATNCAGETAVAVHPVQVVPVGCDPVHGVTLDWSPLTPTVGQSVAFTGTALGDPPITYAWTFGDGGVGSGPNAGHTYTAAGPYTVTLTAQNCGGVTAQAEGVIVVQALPCEAVQVVTVTTLVNGCRVAFQSDLTGDPPFTYLWALGDGMTSTASMPTHTYAQSGTYSATLDLWNCVGAGHDTYAFAVQVECAEFSWRVYLPVLFK